MATLPLSGSATRSEPSAELTLLSLAEAARSTMDQTSLLFGEMEQLAQEPPPLNLREGLHGPLEALDRVRVNAQRAGHLMARAARLKARLDNIERAAKEVWQTGYDSVVVRVMGAGARLGEWSWAERESRFRTEVVQDSIRLRGIEIDVASGRAFLDAVRELNTSIVNSRWALSTLVTTLARSEELER